MTEKAMSVCSFCAKLGATKKVKVEYTVCSSCDISEYTVRKHAEPVAAPPPYMPPPPPSVMRAVPQLKNDPFTPPEELKL